MYKNLEYARKMTDAEWLKIVNFRSNQYGNKLEGATTILNQRYKEFINHYHEVEKRYLQINGNVLQQIETAKLLKAQKKCVCGASIKFINGYNFWGCTNYQDKTVEHRNFESGIFVYEEPILKNYLTDILYKVGCKKEVTSKALLQFYNDNGLEDLKSKYGQGSSQDLINRYTTVKKVSYEFEQETELRLRGIFQSVQPQFKVIYKYEGEKEKHCIIDLLCSDSSGVFIYECKTSNYDRHDSQEALYKDIIQKIIDTLKIPKTLYFRYAFQNEY